MAGRLRRIQAAGDAADHGRHFLDHRLSRRADEGRAADDEHRRLVLRYHRPRSGADLAAAGLRLAGAAHRGGDGGVPGADQPGAGRHHRAALVLQPRLVQRDPEQGRGVVLAALAARLHAVGLRLRRKHGDRVRGAIDAGDPLAALAHRILRGALARRPYPLPHEPHRQRGGQPGPAYRRRRQPLHRRRRKSRCRHLFLLDPPDLDAVVAGVVRGRAVGALRQLHHSGDPDAHPRLPVLGRARLCGGRDLDHPCDRTLAGRALLRAPAHGGRFPLLARPAS